VANECAIPPVARIPHLIGVVRATMASPTVRLSAHPGTQK
jgi:hypothetical protein